MCFRDLEDIDEISFLDYLRFRSSEEYLVNTTFVDKKFMDEEMRDEKLISVIFFFY